MTDKEKAKAYDKEQGNKNMIIRKNLIKLIKALN